MNALIQLRSLGPGRLLAMAGVGVATLAFIIFMVVRVATPQMELLYGNLAPADAKKVITQLDAQKVPYQLTNNGQDIMVPTDQKQKLRLQTADQVQGGATIGYEIFDQQNALGQTNFVQNLNQLRAMEGELARTIMSIENIKHARVHLVLPQREMFSRVERVPSASVIVAMNSGRLSQEQVLAIQNMIAAAVPKLQPNQVAITDTSGALLARANDNQQNLMLTNAEEIRRAHEMRLTQAVEDMLGRTVGAGKVRAEVRVDMNLDRTITNTQTFDPEKSVPLSTVTVEDGSKSNEQQPDTVSVTNNLPDANASANPGAQATTSASRTEETVNYQTSSVTINKIKEIGDIRRVTVAVMVDGTYDDQGKYTPRTPEQIAQFKSLVERAVGFDATRGDEIEVANLQFIDLAADVAGPQEPLFFGMFTKGDLMRAAEGMALALVAVLVVLLVVRPLITRAFESLPEAATGPDGRRLLTEQGEAAGQLTGPGRGPMPGGTMPSELESEELIDIDKVEGRVRASSLKKIGEIVEKHPEEALSIVRNWLYSEGGGPPSAGG